MASDPRNRNGAARRALRARIRAMGMPCGICGRPIDYSLPAGHPMSFEVDEVVPVSRGGSPIDPANCQAAHRICNQRRGNRPLQSARAERGAARGGDACSRDWRRPPQDDANQTGG